MCWLLFLITISSFLHGMEEESSCLRSRRRRHRKIPDFNSIIPTEESSVQEQYVRMMKHMKEIDEYLQKYEGMLSSQERAIRDQKKEIDEQAKEINRLYRKIERSKEKRKKLEKKLSSVHDLDKQLAYERRRINELYSLRAQSGIAGERGGSSAWGSLKLMPLATALQQNGQNN